jgi:hypothetical protein
MIEESDGAGQFESVTPHPIVTITPASDPALAEDLHHRVGGVLLHRPLHQHTTPP